MSRPPDRAQAARLRQLAQLARLQADRETARLGETARARGRILAALAALGRGEDPLAAEAPTDALSAPASAPAAGPASGAGPAARNIPASGTDRTAADAETTARSATGGGGVPAGPPPGADLSARAIPALVVRARLAHRVWIEARRAELQMRLARIEADWLRLRPKAALAFGRAEVLDGLADTAERQARQRRTDAGEVVPRPAGPGPNRRP